MAVRVLMPKGSDTMTEGRVLKWLKKEGDPVATGEALLVVRMHRTHRESVDKAIRLLHAANVKPAGIVLTHRRFIIPNYLYRYS